MLVASVSRHSIVDSYGLKPSKWLHVEHHIHIDKGAVNVSAYSFGSQQPATAPRNQGDKKYISFRRMMGNDFGNGYRWPSI